MDGTCDVDGCTNETFMGWAPIGEQKGRQIREYHFRQHDDAADSFNLWDAFGCERPVRSPRWLIRTVTRRCDCGRALSGRRRFCEVCQRERECKRKKRAYLKQVEKQLTSINKKLTNRQLVLSPFNRLACVA